MSRFQRLNKDRRNIMKKTICFVGELGDTLEDVIPEIIEEAKKLPKDEFLFVNWNGGFAFPVSPIDTKDTILECYENELSKRDIYNRYQRGEFITKEQLAHKLRDKILT